MMRLLHLSDTHFGTEVPEVVEALGELADQLRPQALLLSGDITQRATRAQFRSARRFLDRLAVPQQLLLPGNHDIPLFDLPRRLLAPYRRYRQELAQSALEGVHDLPGLRLIRVKSTRRRRHIDGELSTGQVRMVARALRESPPDALRLVVTHQPLWVDRASDAHNVCHGADEALAAWREAGADLLLAGHIHWPFACRLEGKRPLWAINAGTALSSRVRDGVPQSCNLLSWDPAQPRRGARLQRWDYHGPTQGFVAVGNTLLHVDP